MPSHPAETCSGEATEAAAAQTCGSLRKTSSREAQSLPSQPRGASSRLGIAREQRPLQVTTASRLLKKGTQRGRGPVGCGVSRKETATHDGDHEHPGFD